MGRVKLRDYELSVSNLFANGSLDRACIERVLTQIEIHDLMARCVEKLPYHKIARLRGVSTSCALATCWRAANKLMHMRMDK